MRTATVLLIAVVAVGAFLVGGCPPQQSSGDPNNSALDAQGQDLTLGTNALPTAADKPPVTPATDSDGDGLSDTEEAELGTSSATADSDGDTLTDPFEIGLGLDPKVANTVLKITKVESKACIVLADGALWFSWSTWTDAFQGWTVDQRVVVLPSVDGASTDATLYNVSRTDVIPTQARTLGQRTGSGTVAEIVTEPDLAEDGVTVHGEHPVELKIDADRWTITSGGKNTHGWQVGDKIVFAYQADGGVRYAVNKNRNEFVAVTEKTGG